MLITNPLGRRRGTVELAEEVIRQEDLLLFLTDCGALNYLAGREISYSNTGCRLVEEALNAKGIAFTDLLQRYICTPLGIRLHVPATWFDIVPRLVPSYWRDRQSWQIACASGSAASRLRDLVPGLQSLLGENAETVLTRLSAPRRLADRHETGYSLGLTYVRWDEAYLLGHGLAPLAATLRQLGQGQLLATACDGLWRKRILFTVRDDQLVLTTHRSRIVRHCRA